VSRRVVREGDAVMFDIDETLIHTNGEPIKEMITLFNVCKNLGYRTIIITARPDHPYTRRQLAKNLISPHELYFCPAVEKTNLKRRTGHRYILSVGDLQTDLGHSEYFIKLPDKYDKKVYSNISRTRFFLIASF